MRNRRDLSKVKMLAQRSLSADGRRKFLWSWRRAHGQKPGGRSRLRHSERVWNGWVLIGRPLLGAFNVASRASIAPLQQHVSLLCVIKSREQSMSKLISLFITT